VDWRTHPLKDSASTDVRDGLVDIGVGRILLLLEQCRHRHDHATPAVSALRNVVIDPGLLHLGELCHGVPLAVTRQA
jgi:hypothetical protein